MSVLIKGMDMPKNCKKGNCPFRGIGGCVSGRYEEVWCHAADNRVEWEVVSDERSKDCPLVEVKTPHGKLKDADNIKVFSDLWEAPTVIEAEE